MNAAEKILRIVGEAVPAEREDENYRDLCSRVPLQKIDSKKSHKTAMTMMVTLMRAIHEVGEEETPSGIYRYLEALGLLIEAYEKGIYPSVGANVSAEEMLRFLMEQNGLKQVDLAKDLGGQSVVSEILAGKRELNAAQIRTLSKRFNVSPNVFFP